MTGLRPAYPWLPLALLIALPQQSRAQSVAMPDGTRLPSAPLRSPGGKAWVVWSTRDDLAPRAEAPRTGSAEVLDLHFRYASSGGWALIGPEPRFDPAGTGATPGKAVAGWVSDDLVIPYEGRFAADWDRRPTLPGAAPRRPA